MSETFVPLERSQRISIACTFYGLYMIGFAISESAKVDEDCAMDNMGVPYYQSQLTEDHKLYLENPSTYRNKKVGMGA